jgi:hypothetical protein
MGKWLILPLVFFATAALVLSTGYGTELIEERLRSITESTSTSGIESRWHDSAPPISLSSLASQGGASVETISLPFTSLRSNPAVRVLSGEGDRREEVAVLIETVAEVYGDDARAAVQSIHYDPEADATRVVVYPDLPAWKAYISSSLPKVLAASSAEVR